MSDDLRPETPEHLEIYPENWDVVQLFLRLQTQWRISPMGQRIGLEYTSLKPVAKVMGLKFTPDLFGDLQLMEITAINECLKNDNR